MIHLISRRCGRARVKTECPKRGGEKDSDHWCGEEEEWDVVDPPVVEESKIPVSLLVHNLQHSESERTYQYRT